MSVKVRRVRMRHQTKDGPETYGGYYQAISYFRDPASKQSRTQVIAHLGEHATPEAALAEWPREIEKLRDLGRERQAKKLERKLERLRVALSVEGGPT